MINNKQKNNQLTIKQKQSGHNKTNKKNVLPVCRPHNLYSLTVRVRSAQWPMTDHQHVGHIVSKRLSVRDTVCNISE